MAARPQQWKFILVLSCFSLVGYALRMNISIAAVQMMPALHLSTIELGQLFSGFLIGYTVFQIPWGLFGDRFGARAVLCIAALSWAATTLASGLLPGLLVKSTAASFACLCAARLLLGVGEAAGFPVAARAIASRMPHTRHGFGYAAVVTGTALGSALTPPAVSWLVSVTGWRSSFYWSSAAALLLAIVWFFVARDEQPAAPASRALAALAAPQEAWWRLLRNPSVALICLSYFFESYVLYVFVFWSYLYLIQQRHFTLLRGGVFTGLPFLVGAVAVPIVGLVSDWLTERRGYSVGRRIPAIATMVSSAAFLFLAVTLNHPYAAIAALSLSVASLLSVEAIFWSSSIAIGGRYAGTCGGIMNTAGNLGGIVSTAVVPLLLNRYGWTIAFGSASALIFCAALVWLRIDPQAGDSPRSAQLG